MKKIVFLILTTFLISIFISCSKGKKKTKAEKPIIIKKSNVIEKKLNKKRRKIKIRVRRRRRSTS